MQESESGETVWERELHRALGGAFEGSFRLEKPGQYKLLISLKGETLGGIRYGSDTPHPIYQEKEYILEPPITGFQISNIRIGRAIRGEEIPIWVSISCLEGASVQKVEANVEEETVSLHDDGKPPDERAEDGIFGGMLPPLDEVGKHRVEIKAEGETAYGVPFSDHEERTFDVGPSLVSRLLHLTLAGGIPLLLYLGIAKFPAQKWRERRRKALPRGTLSYEGERVYLDNVAVAGEVPLGLGEEGIELPLERGVKYACIYGRREGCFPQLPCWFWLLWPAEWLFGVLCRRSGRWDWGIGKVITYIEAIQEIRVNGERLAKGKNLPLKGKIQIGEHTLKYFPL